MAPQKHFMHVQWSSAGSTVHSSIVICVSPFTADQVAPRGLKTDFVGEAQTDGGAVRRVLKGEQLVYISPESILDNPKYGKMLLRPVNKLNLIALMRMKLIAFKLGVMRKLVICIVSYLNELIVALAATTTQQTLSTIIERLNPFAIDPAVTVVTSLDKDFAKVLIFPKQWSSADGILTALHHLAKNAWQ